MTDATLQHFRDLAEVLSGPDPKNWQWIGKYTSQRMFGITEQRAKEYARLYGGTASQMENRNIAN